MTRDKADVLVIGAGAAGLSAAHELSAGGLSVVVIEARDRIGGRVYTLHDDSASIPIELGAEFVHGKPPEIFNLVQRAGLTLCDTTERHWYSQDGRLMESGESWSRLEAIMDQMKSLRDDCSFQEFLGTLPDDEETTKMVATRYVQGFHAARPERIGIHGLKQVTEAAESIDGDKSFRIIGGYDRLLEWLRKQAERRGATVRLNLPVKEIRWKKDDVEALSVSGEAMIGTSALLTLPLGVLQAKPSEPGAVRFAPELPGEITEAIDGLAMGDVVKINLRFRTRFWETLELPANDDETESLWQLGFIHSSLPAFPTWWTMLPLRAPVLIGWVGGPEAERVSQWERPDIIEQALSSLAKILNISSSQVNQDLDQCYLHNWHSDPFARGGYSYLPVGGLDLQTRLRRPIRKTLYFAGEALSNGHVGTVHGAMMSGIHAGRQILRDHQEKGLK